MHTASLILAATAAVVAAQAPTPPVLPAPWFNHAFGQTVGDQTASSVSVAILAENYDAPAPALVQVSYNTGFTGTQVVWQRCVLIDTMAWEGVRGGRAGRRAASASGT